MFKYLAPDNIKAYGNCQSSMSWCLAIIRLYPFATKPLTSKIPTRYGDVLNEASVSSPGTLLHEMCHALSYQYACNREDIEQCAGHGFARQRIATALNSLGLPLKLSRSNQVQIHWD
jgi:hypothetical protein